MKVWKLLIYRINQNCGTVRDWISESDISMNRSNTMQILRRWRARSWPWWMIRRWCGSSRTPPSRAMWSTTKSATSSARWSRNARTGRPEVCTTGTGNQSTGPRGTSAQMCVCVYGNSLQFLGDLSTVVCAHSTDVTVCAHRTCHIVTPNQPLRYW